MCIMVNNMVDNEEQKKLEKTFKSLDKNGDGVLQYEELLAGMVEAYGEAIGTEECDRIFKAVDSDNSGEIGLQEFMQACANREKLLDEKSLKASFAFFDRDKSGTVTVEELRDALGVGDGKNIDEKVWLEVINEVDENGDGEIDFDEFKNMMIKLGG